MESLLDKALAYIPPQRGVQRQFSREEIELAVAYYNGTVNSAQVKVATESKNGEYFVRAALLEGVKRRLVTVRMN